MRPSNAGHPTRRHLVVVLGDQLSRDASAFDGFDVARDLVWMAEPAEESTHVRSGKARSTLFLSAMRHFAEALRTGGVPLHYRRLDDPSNRGSLRAELTATVAEVRPQAVVVTEPGDVRTLDMLREVTAGAGLPLDVRTDRHFLCSIDDFRVHAKGRKTLRIVPVHDPVWDFLGRHQRRLARNPRMALQLENAARLSRSARSAIGARAARIRAGEVGSA